MNGIKEAMEELKRSLNNSEIVCEMFALWEEYSAQSSPEAKLVKDLDRLEMIIQAAEYEDCLFSSIIILYNLN